MMGLETAEARQRWARVALISPAFGFMLLVARNQLLTDDPTYYVGLSESLAAGHGYTFMGQPHTQYPPGLSLLLLPVVAIFGPNVLASQLLVALFAPLSLAAALFFIRVFDRRAEFVVGLLVVVAYSFFALATKDIRAELPYLAATACALGLTVDSNPKGAASFAPSSRCGVDHCRSPVSHNRNGASGCVPRDMDSSSASAAPPRVAGPVSSRRRACRTGGSRVLVQMDRGQQIRLVSEPAAVGESSSPGPRPRGSHRFLAASRQPSRPRSAISANS